MTTYMPKVYNQNGTGRDSYIFFNNGGFYPAQERFLAQRVQESWAYGSPRRLTQNDSNEKRQFYFSNGTGRDTYILKTVQDKVSFPLEFPDQLRKYSSQVLSPKYPYKLPPLKQSQNLERSLLQQSMINRLSVPKRKTE